MTTVFDFRGNLSQWIELYNSGSSDVDLAGYHISDDPNDPFKYTIKLGTAEAGHFYILWLERNTKRLTEIFTLDPEEGFVAIYSPSGVLQDSITFGMQFHDVSYGRTSLHGDEWAYYVEPTPWTSNTTPALLNPVLPEEVRFSLRGGFYAGEQLLELSTGSSTGTIRYTMDGSWPGESSPVYTDPILISENSVIRARLYEEDQVPGNVSTHSYFIDEEISYPVVSITTNPEYFYGNLYGIYVRGTNGITGYCMDEPVNWNNDWERPINFEFFSEDGSQQISQIAGTKIFGGCSRMWWFKSLAIYARNQYGDNRLKYKLFKDKDIEEYKTIVLRNSGNDAYYTLFRDGFMQSLVIGKMDIDYQAYQPVVIFVNGEYKGMLNMREKINEHYPASNYDIDPDDIDMLEGLRFLYYGEIISGSGESFTDLVDFMKNNSLSVQENYNYVCTQIDVNEFMNYYFAHIYFQNEDWPSNNVKHWRSQAEGGKWRWVLFDTDFGWGLYPQSGNCLEHATEPGDARLVIRSLLENEGFKNEWVQRMAAHISTTFDPATVTPIFDSIVHLVEQEIYRHIIHLKKPEVSFFREYVDIRMPDFTEKRPDIMRGQIMDKFGIAGMYNLSTEVNDPSMGYIQAAGVRLPQELNSPFFINIPLRLTATPRSGYAFSHWEGASISSSRELLLDLSSDTAITAVFEPATAMTGVFINEVSATSKPGITDEYGQADDWIEIYNDNEFDVDLAGWFLSDSSGFHCMYRIPDGLPEQTTVKSKSYLTFWTDDQSTQGPLHTNFKLRREGEYISLVQQLGEGYHIVDSLAYPEIHPELTYGRHPESGQWEYFLPTPNAMNEVGVQVTLCINEFVSRNDGSVEDEYGESDDWLEIFNPGDQPVDVGGLFITDSLMNPLRHMIPRGDPSTLIPPRGYLVLWADNQPEQGVLHLGFKLSAGSEQIGLYQVGIGYVDSLSYEIEYSESAFGCYPDGTGQYQYLTATPGAANSVRILEHLFINEFMASNGSTVADEYGEYDDWIEIYNGNSDAVDVGGLFISDSLADLTKFRIPSNQPDTTTIPAGGYLVLWADNQEEQGVLHLGFKLSADGEEIGLVQADGMSLIDKLSYAEGRRDLAVGRLEDGSDNIQYVSASPGAPNHVRVIEQVCINEFMASNGCTVADEYGEYDDWIEIYNGNDHPVDLGGIFVTDSLAFPGKHLIPIGKPDSTTIPAGGYLVLWADSQEEQGVLHLGFKLSADGEEIGLVQPDGMSLLDSLSYPAMRPDMAYGRLEDGSDHLQIVTASPAAPNFILDTEQLYLSEIVASGNTSHPDEHGEYDDWIELHNSNSYPVDIGGMFMTDSFGDLTRHYIPTWYPDSTTIQAGGYLILWADGQEDQGILHLGFRLNGNGEELALIGGDGILFVDSVSYPEQYSNFSYSRLDDTGPWKFLRPTHAEHNELAAITGIYINEFSASNSRIPDEYGETNDWIELHNTNSYPVDIGGLYLTDSIAKPTRYRIPSHTPEKTTIPAGGYYVFFADNDKDKGINHTNFSLRRSGEQIGIVHYDESTLLDTLSYGEQYRNSALAKVYDTCEWHTMPPTPGAFNSLPDLQGLVFNEVMADNVTSFADDAGEYDDWIELYNGSSHPIDIGGLYISDSLDDPMMVRISSEYPDSTTISSGRHLVLWADKDEEQGILHLGVKISKSGEQIGLFGYLAEVIDSLTVPMLGTNISWGRTSDGNSSWTLFTQPTPLMANIMTSDGSPGKDEQQCLVYPNPIFTACIFEVPVDGNGNARIEIYDAMGTLRSLMQKEYRESGTMQFTWDARDASGTRLPAGYYMYRIISGEQIFTGKILINR